jgi:hypothetical protein
VLGLAGKDDIEEMILPKQLNFYSGGLACYFLKKVLK